MARKKKHEKEPNMERWLISYADFITLLFALFVTLYASSQTDKSKMEALVASLRESFGTIRTGATAGRVNVVESMDLRPIPSIKPDVLVPGLRRSPGEHAASKEFAAIKADIEAHLARFGAQDKVSVEVTRRGLVVSLKEVGFFDSGRAELKPSSYPLLDLVAAPLARYANPIRVEGNTDNVPIGTSTFRSNWELSTARATNLVHHLLANHPFRPENISAVGYGEYRPIADNRSEAGRAKNRRVDIVLLTQEGEAAEPPPAGEEPSSEP